MTTIEKIKAEIERLKGQLIRGACAAQIEMETNCKEEAYDEVLSFLSTLEPEKPMNLDFEQELYNRFGMVKDFTLGMRIAQAFYELGCTRTAEKYDEIEYNRQRAEESPLPEDTVLFNKGVEEGKRLMMEEAVEVYPCFDKRRRLTGFSIDPEADGTNGWSCRIILCKIK